MPIVLPPSLRKELHSIEEEVAEFREMTPEQRLGVLDSLCRDAAVQAALQSRVGRLREWEEPLPDSTVRALIRLRSSALAR